jgi:hypothetical protein
VRVSVCGSGAEMEVSEMSEGEVRFAREPERECWPASVWCEDMRESERRKDEPPDCDGRCVGRKDELFGFVLGAALLSGENDARGCEVWLWAEPPEVSRVCDGGTAALCARPKRVRKPERRWVLLVGRSGEEGGVLRLVVWAFVCAAGGGSYGGASPRGSGVIGMLSSVPATVSRLGRTWAALDGGSSCAVDKSASLLSFSVSVSFCSSGSSTGLSCMRS